MGRVNYHSDLYLRDPQYLDKEEVDSVATLPVIIQSF